MSLTIDQPVFQEYALALALCDKTACEYLVEHGKAGYFEVNESHRWLFELITKVWKTGRELATAATVEMELADLPSQLRSQYTGPVLTIINHVPDAAAQVTYLRMRLDEWLRRARVVSALLASVELLKAEELDKATEHITAETNYTRAMQIGKRDPNYDIPGGAKALLDRQEADRKRDDAFTSCTGLSTLDQAMGGGIKPEEIGCLMGYEKTGKSINLSIIAAAGFRTGLATQFVALEGRSSQIVNRILAACYQVNPKALEHGKIGRGKQEKMLADMEEYCGGALRVTTLTDRADYTPADVLAEVAKFEESKHRTVQLLVIDYCDWLKPSWKSGEKQNTYTEQVRVFQEVRAIAQGRGLAVWTAVQAQRKQNKGFGLLYSSDVSDSIGKMRICDFMISLNRDPDYANNHITHWFMPIHRNADFPQLCVRVKTDYDRMMNTEDGMSEHTPGGIRKLDPDYEDD